jgi:ABC-2 type transport system permease protein
MKLKNIFSRRNRILLRELVVTDFKLRYQGSVLGYLWSLLKPLLLFTILYIVFVRFLRFGEGIPHFEVSLLLGIVMWTFFVEATGQGMQAIVGRGDLIRKINFPKYIIVVSGTISALINLLLNLLVVLVFIVINGVDLRATLLILPLNILEIYVFALAVAFILSAVYVKYRDLSHIWEIFLQGFFYATPILYPLTMVIDNVGRNVAELMLLNPIAQTIQDARYNAVTEQTITTFNFLDHKALIIIPYAIVILAIIYAVYYFRKNQPYFAENV